MRSVLNAVAASGLATLAWATAALADEAPDPPRIAGQSLNLPLAVSAAVVVLGVAVIAVFLARRRKP
jgi:hypothetical protein